MNSTDASTKPSSRSLSGSGRAYVTIVVCLGSMTVVTSVVHFATTGLPAGWLFFAALTLLSGYFTVKVPSISSTISVSETFVFCAVLLYGPEAGTLTVALDAAVIATRVGRLRPWHRALFNLSAGPLSMWIAATLYAGISKFSGPATSLSLQGTVLPLFALAGCYFLLNSLLVAGALAFETQQSAWVIWRRNLLWLSVNYFGGVSVAALLVPYALRIDPAAIAIVIPLLVLTYMTFKTTLGRVEDSTRHVSQITRLYLTAIESLAAAVDAKDQVTHGHIRRVQGLARSLAIRLGVRDDSQLKAIDAASLLHDMGKLAIPEFILNKPGRLTGEEFEIMKTHAAIGADMIKTIEFPYPVQPIVRSHHENWDGSGYPDGLAATNIPLGARILSVVDCYDALTSDRPYRRALSSSEATAILVNRRGSMYDPLVVDAFVDMVRTLDPVDAVSSNAQEQHLSRTAVVKARPLPQSDLGDCLVASALTWLPPDANLDSVCRLISGLLDDVDGIAVFLLSRDGTTLQTAATWRLGKFIEVHEMKLGERISGWAVANCSVALNSPASIEFSPSDMRDRVVLSVPILIGTKRLGAVTAISTPDRRFTSGDASRLEIAASQLGVLLDRFAAVSNFADHVLDHNGLSQLQSHDSRYRFTVRIRTSGSDTQSVVDAQSRLLCWIRPVDRVQFTSYREAVLEINLASPLLTKALAQQLSPHWEIVSVEHPAWLTSERSEPVATKVPA